MPNKFNFKIYYEDTDAGGIVYYANYLKYIERARTEILKINGIKQRSLLLEQGLAFVVSKVNASYKIPARLDDELFVETRLQKLKAASINLVQDIKRSGEVIFSAEVTIVAVDMKTNKPVKIPEEIKQIFIKLST